MKYSMMDVSSAVLALCAVVLTGVALKREYRHDPTPRSGCRSIEAQPSLLTGGHYLGSQQAPVTVVEFIDYQCPYCARVQTVLNDVLRKHAEDVRIQVRHFPIASIHPHALEAALAVECAGAQGRFREYSGLLLLHQDSIGILSWHDIARRAAVPRLHEFDNCVVEQRFARVVERDAAEGVRLGVGATPSFIVGRDLCEGVPDSLDLEDRINLLIAKQRPQGPRPVGD